MNYAWTQGLYRRAAAADVLVVLDDEKQNAEFGNDRLEGKLDSSRGCAKLVRYGDDT